MNFIILILLFLCRGLGASTLTVMGSPAEAVEQFATFELALDFKGSYANPYDPAEAELIGQFSGPGGRMLMVRAFPYQDFVRSSSLPETPPQADDSEAYHYNPRGEKVSLSPTGKPHWRIRFTPDTAGIWSLRLTARDKSGMAMVGPLNVTVTPSTRPGFIRISKNDPHYFARDNGELWFGIGENLGWGGHEQGVFQGMEEKIEAVAASGGNFIRVWMAHWAFNVEWKDTPIGDYSNRQNLAWQLDRLLALCERLNVGMMLCLVNHGAYSSTVNSNWTDNPYNAANGGFLQKPQEVWTSLAWQNQFERRLRYITARWGHSTALQAWEFWNEMEWVDEYKDNAAHSAEWHKKNAALIRSLDPYQHLVTTSYAGYPGEKSVWETMDYTQGHEYGSKDKAETVRVYATGLRAQSGAKPFLMGEFGLEGDWKKMAAEDPKGLNLHEMAWGSLMAKAASSGMTWYWDTYVPRQNLYFRNTGIARFIKGEALDRQGYESVSLPVQSLQRSDFNLAPGSSTWGQKPPQHEFEVLESGELRPGAGGLNGFQYSKDKMEFRNPPSFKVRYARQGTFKVHVNNVSDNGARATILLDGKLALHQDLKKGSQDTTLSLKVPAGEHILTVDSTGADWYHTSLYSFADYSPLLRASALKSKNRVLGWVQSRNHTYFGVLKDWPRPMVKDARLDLQDMGERAWVCEWWDTQIGQLIFKQKVRSTAGRLKLKVPPLNSDLAFKLY